MHEDQASQSPPAQSEAGVQPYVIPRSARFRKFARNSGALLLSLAAFGNAPASAIASASAIDTAKTEMAQSGLEPSSSSGHIVDDASGLSPEQTADTAAVTPKLTSTEKGSVITYTFDKDSHGRNKKPGRNNKNNSVGRHWGPGKGYGIIVDSPKKHKTSVPPKSSTKPSIPVTTTPAQPEAPTITLPLPSSLYGELTPPTESFMEQNAVTIPGLGCSGWLIRNAEGLAVGVFFAKHCLPGAGNLTTDENGNPAFTFNEQLNVMWGDEAGDLDAAPGENIPIGVMNEVFTDISANNDMAIGIFGEIEGLDRQEVVNTAQSMLMSASQSDTLAEGSVAFERGMPDYQPDNSTGEMQMQNLAMTVLGPDTWDVTDSVNGGTTSTENIKVLVTAVGANADGSECSPGNSGSMLFVNTPIGPQLIGVASAYADWGTVQTAGNNTAAQANLTYYQNRFNTNNLSDYNAVCAFYQSMPDPNSPTTAFYNILVTADNSVGVEDFVDQFADDLFEQGAELQQVSGWVFVPNSNGVQGGTWLYDPSCIFYPGTNTAFFTGYANNGLPEDYERLAIIGTADLSSVQVYSNSSESQTAVAPSMTALAGPLSFNSTQTGFQDQNGNPVGQDVQSSSSPTVPGATLSTTESADGSYQFVMTQPAGGSVPIASPGS